MKGHVAGAGDSPVNLSLTMMIYKGFKIGCALFSKFLRHNPLLVVLDELN